MDEGTLAPIELTRANAQVFATRQDLINARGLLEEQEAILKNVLTRAGNEDPDVRGRHIIPTDALTIPEQDEVRPIQDLLAEALAQPPRPGPGARCRSRIRRSGWRAPEAPRCPKWTWWASCRTTAWPGRLNPSAPSTNTPVRGRLWHCAGSACCRQVSHLWDRRASDRCRYTTASPKPTWRATSCN